jgi:hypothetical protein
MGSSLSSPSANWLSSVNHSRNLFASPSKKLVKDWKYALSSDVEAMPRRPPVRTHPSTRTVGSQDREMIVTALHHRMIDLIGTIVS